MKDGVAAERSVVVSRVEGAPSQGRTEQHIRTKARIVDRLGAPAYWCQ